MLKKDIDLHIHSSYSDGSDSVAELLEIIKREGIRYFSLTDHDTVDGIREMEQLVPEDICFIPGIEFSCVSDAGKCHILGYGIDIDNPVFQETVQEASTLRYDKLSQRLTYLKETYQITFNESELKWLYSQNSAGRPHIAELMIRRGIVSSSDEAFEKYLGQMPSPRIDTEKAIRAIRDAGGIAVWAHPYGEKKSKFLSEEELLKQLKALMKMGIQGLECYYSEYDDERNQCLVKLARENNLWISGGSDYHGARKGVALGTLGLGIYPIDPEASLSVLEKLGVWSWSDLFESFQADLWVLIADLMNEKYDPDLSPEKYNRCIEEASSFMSTYDGASLLLARELLLAAKEKGYACRVEGNLEASFVAYLLGLIPNDPVEKGLPFEDYILSNPDDELNLTVYCESSFLGEASRIVEECKKKKPVSNFRVKEWEEE